MTNSTPVTSANNISDTPTLTSYAQATPANTTVYVSLGTIIPDLRQPRQWLPLDIRQGLGKKWATGADAMQELLTRAGSGDLEAKGYLNSLKNFAEDIMEVGLQVPIKVFLLPSGGTYRYQIKHGERRWWACLYLAATSGLSPQASLETTIEAFVDPEADGQTADELRRTQWSENFQREDVSLIDVVCEVSRVYDGAYARAEMQRKAMLEQLGWADEEQVTSTIAVAIAQNEVQTSMGKSLGRSSIMAYAQLAGKINPIGQGLARAFHFSFRDLERLSRTAAATEQESLARSPTEKILGAENPHGSSKSSQTVSTPVSTQPPDSNTINGRPTRARRFITMCLKLPEQLGKNTDRQLAQLKGTELQEMYSAAQQAQRALNEYCKLLSATLSRPGLADKG